MKDWFLILSIAFGMGVMGFGASLLGPFSLFGAFFGLYAAGAWIFLIARNIRVLRMRIIAWVLGVSVIGGVSYLSMNETLFSGGFNPIGLMVLTGSGTTILWLVLYALKRLYQSVHWSCVRFYYETWKPLLASLRKRTEA